MSKRVLITGATGFVGGHAAEAYLAAGWNVRILARSRDRAERLEALGCETCIGDVTDLRSIEMSLDGVYCVVHCAGLTKAVKRSDYFRINADATRDLIRSSGVSGVKRFVYCSSQAASHPATEAKPALESDPSAPVTDYGRSKLAGENHVRESGASVEWIIVRPSAVMGPRDEQFVPLFRAMYRWGVYPVFGDGSQRYSAIYAKDLARVLLMCGETVEGLNEIYFAAHDHSLSWSEAAIEMQPIVGRKLRPLRLTSSTVRIAALIGETVMSVVRRPFLLSRDKVNEILAEGWVCSSDKAKNKLGFSCEYGTREMLHEAFGWYLRNGKL